MKPTKIELRKRFAVNTIVALLTAAQLLPYTASAQSYLSSDAIRRQSQYATAQQAVYQLVAEAKDSDADGLLEAPAMKLGPNSGPLDGGVIPDNSGAPKTDSFGGLLGYCAWDNGSANLSTGRLQGGTTASSISLAVISYGLDNTFQTSCADVTAGITRGDDYVFKMTQNQMATVASSTTSTFWGAPVTSSMVLSDLATQDASTGGTLLHEGEIRLSKDTNLLYRWDAIAKSWNRIGGGINWTDVGATDSTLINGKAAIGQPTIGAERLTINGGTLQALGLRGAGSMTGANIYNTSGSAVNAFLGYDNANSKMLIDVQTGSFAIKTGGTERFSIGTDGSVLVNGSAILDSNRNLSATAGTFTGVVNTSGGYQVAGTTVIDTSRNLVNINSINTSGNANTGSLSIGGTVVIDGNRNATLNALTTTGVITANGGINTTTLTATTQLIGPTGSAGLPAYAFAGSSTTGMYSPTANMLALSAGGVQVMAASASTGVTTPAGLTVSGGNFVLSGNQVTGTFAARPAASVAGRLYITTDTNEIFRDTGAAWVRVGAGQLASMTDTAIVLPSDGQLLTFNSGTGKWTNANLLAGNGVAVTTSNGAVTVGLTNIGAAGTYGSSTQIPVLTTDAQGRVTAVTNTTVNVTSALGYTPTRSNGDGNSVVSQDTRATNYSPQDRDSGAHFDLKNNSTDGLSDGGSVHGVMTFRPYGSGADFSGGPAHQLAVTENGGLWQRSGSGATWSGWRSISPRAAADGMPLKTCAGQTTLGATNWVQYANNSLYVDITFPATCGFTQRPVVVTGLYGGGSLWDLLGGNSAYGVTPTGFRVYVKPAIPENYPADTITPVSANAGTPYRWGLNWVAYGV